jgi:hypothetical protein
MSFAAITPCVASQRVVTVVVVFVMTQSGNFWIHPRTIMSCVLVTKYELILLPDQARKSRRIFINSLRVRL